MLQILLIWLASVTLILAASNTEQAISRQRARVQRAFMESGEDALSCFKTHEMTRGKTLAVKMVISDTNPVLLGPDRAKQPILPSTFVVGEWDYQRFWKSSFSVQRKAHATSFDCTTVQQIDPALDKITVRPWGWDVLNMRRMKHNFNTARDKIMNQAPQIDQSIIAGGWTRAVLAQWETHHQPPYLPQHISFNFFRNIQAVGITIPGNFFDFLLNAQILSTIAHYTGQPDPGRQNPS